MRTFFKIIKNISSKILIILFIISILFFIQNLDCSKSVENTSKINFSIKSIPTGQSNADSPFLNVSAMNYNYATNGIYTPNSYNLTGTYFYNGIEFDPYYSTSVNYTNVSIYIYFKTPMQYSGNFQILCLDYENTTQYNLGVRIGDANFTNFSSLTITPTDTTMIIDQNVYRVYNLKYEYSRTFGLMELGYAFRVIEPSTYSNPIKWLSYGSYFGQNSYNEGYNEGVNTSQNNAYNNGYNQGFADGQADTGVANSLFFGVKEVLNVLGNNMVIFLSTPIVGDMTIGLFVLGIPLTFLIISVVIRLIKFFMGAGGNNE